MKKLFVMLVMMSIGTYVNAHQWTPTYPELKQSYMDNILEAKMILFNKRTDVEYYEIGVFDENWHPIKFAAQEKLIHIKSLETKNITIYIRKQDEKRTKYICTTSKLVKGDTRATVIASRICSKIK